MSLTHKIKDDFKHLEFTSPSGRPFDAQTITQGDIERMPEKQKAKYLEPISKTDSKSKAN